MPSQPKRIIDESSKKRFASGRLEEATLAIWERYSRLKREEDQARRKKEREKRQDRPFSWLDSGDEAEESSVDDEGEGISEESPNEAAANFLRREVYRLGLICKKFDLYRELLRVASRVRDSKIIRPEVRDNVYALILLSIFADEGMIDRRRRELYANQLEYAERHCIPPHLLTGFLYQSGSTALIRRKLDDQYVEPSFRAITDVRLKFWEQQFSYSELHRLGHVWKGDAQTAYCWI